MFVSGLNHGHTGHPDLQDPHEAQDFHRVASEATTSIWDLPFEAFVEYAVEHAEREVVGVDGWRSQLWEFTRLIRGRCDEATKANHAFGAVDKVVESLGGWFEVFELDRDEAHAEFVTSWPKIRFRPDEDPVDQALRKAEAHPVKAPARDDRRYPTPGYDRFISIVGWLQVTMGDQPIYLPCRRIGDALRTTPRMVSMWRQMAIDEGILKITAEHEFRSKGGSKATEFIVMPGFRSWFEDYLKARVG